jgi:mono/diheme cytochrome c family protein
MEPEPRPEPSPEPEPDDGFDPRARFALLCAPCHGDDFQGGGGGADMAERFPTISDERAFDSIKNGVSPGMPGWAAKLDDEEIRAIIEYLRGELE